MKIAPDPKRRELKKNEEKWTTLLMEAGWTVLPSVILDRQQALGLDPVDVNIILHLAKHWWYRDNPPHPSKKALAECMGLDESTIRRHIARLESDGLIRREARYGAQGGGRQTNVYVLDGLISAATPYAKEAIAAREERRKEDANRRGRKRARFRVVPEGEDR
jgi:DNA-binding transcriptional ArsR family regulator